jgi:multisubunit Na+/H+ antiporter MnhC subunit
MFEFLKSATADPLTFIIVLGALIVITLSVTAIISSGARSVIDYYFNAKVAYKRVNRAYKIKDSESPLKLNEKTNTFS